MGRPKKSLKELKRVTAFSLRPSEIRKLTALANSQETSRSDLVGQWIDSQWDKKSKRKKVCRR